MKRRACSESLSRLVIWPILDPLAFGLDDLDLLAGVVDPVVECHDGYAAVERMRRLDEEFEAVLVKREPAKGVERHEIDQRLPSFVTTSEQPAHLFVGCIRLPTIDDRVVS